MVDVVRELSAKLTFEVDNRGLQRFEEGLEGAKDGAEELEGGVDKAGVATVALGNIVASAATSLVNFAVNGAKRAAEALGEIVFGSAEAADEIAKMAKQLNVDAEQLQRLRGAADLSGASIQDMNRGIRALTVGLADAKTKGSGPVLEGFQALGIAVEDVESLLADGNIEGAVGLIGDAFNETGESAEKNAALLKIFGARAGAELRPLIESGTAGIRDMGDAISSTGEVIDNEMLPTFEKMQDDLRLAQGAVTGAKNEIAGALAPVVSDIAGRFNEWIAENQDFIQQDLPEIMTMIAEALAEVLPWVIDVIVEFKNFYNEMKNIDERLTQDWGPAWDGVKTVLGGVLSIFGAIFDFVGKLIERVDRLIGRFRTVGDVAADAAAQLGVEGGGVRGSVRVGENEQQRRERLAKTTADREADIARQDEARDRENAAWEERRRGLKSEIRAKRAKGEPATKADIQAMEEAGIPDDEIEKIVETSWSATNGGQGTPGRGGGGRGRGRGSTTPAPELPSVDDLIAGAGAGSSRPSVEGGGAGPGLGGTFNTIDASFNGVTQIEVNVGSDVLEGMPPETQGKIVADYVARAMAERDRRIFDHYNQVVRT